ncbi:MAG TPA: hypothetical protein VD905_08765 [Flavobacteriales bacterium]|nr:hypothetical protein [Flavobacteriales bacterium]
MRIVPCVLLFLALLLQSCSWTVPFFIINNTTRPVRVEVSLMDLSKGIPIFFTASSPVSAYHIDKNSTIDYNKPVTLAKKKGTDEFHYTVELPAYSAISLGQLENDRYSAHDQHFINDRVFNLRRIIITEDVKKTEITNINFDAYFYESQNSVIYPVRSVANSYRE